MKRAGSSTGSARRIVAAVAAAAACAASAAACSVLLDWNDFSDGTGEPDAGPRTRGAESAVEVDSATESDAISLPLVSCGTDELCSPAVPSAAGWSGPFALFSGASGTLPSGCDPATYVSAPAFTGNEGLSPTPAQCSCTCAPPEGRSCTPPGVTFYAQADNTCATPCDAGVFLDGGCVVAPTSCPSFVIGSTTPAGGSCVADGGATIPPLTWSKAAMACSPGQTAPRGSCGSGELCLPSSAPFCIMHPGSVACPPGEYYVAPYVYFAGADDTRGCAACSCGAPSSGSCSLSPVAPPPGIPYFDAAAPSGLVYLDTSCVTPSGVFFVPESCPGLPTAKSLKLSATIVLEGGACEPSGATATGSAVPNTPTTFCCTN